MNNAIFRDLRRRVQCSDKIGKDGNEYGIQEQVAIVYCGAVGGPDYRERVKRSKTTFDNTKSLFPGFNYSLIQLIFSSLN